MKKPSFEQSPHLDNVQYELRGEISAVAEQLVTQGHDILQLQLGNPGLFGLRAPQALMDTVVKNLGASQAYCHYKGLLSAREAIEQHWREQQLAETTLDHIFIGNGVSELVHITLQALLSPGDEVLMPQPVYPLWPATTELYGGVVKYYPCDKQNNWLPDIEAMEQQITPDSKAIVIINPNNPTGVVYPRELLEQIASLARKHHLMIFSDEIYSDIVYEPYQFHPMASVSDDVVTITFQGLSKNYLLAGFRCAWAVVSGDVGCASSYLAGVNKLLSMRLCANVPAQHAISEALSNSKHSFLHLYPEMQQKRDLLIDTLNDIDGLSCMSPQGAFYAYPYWDSSVANWETDTAWVLSFLREHHILLAPGSTFCQSDSLHFRLAFLCDWDRLEYTCVKLKQLICDQT
jgi:alanine-synthesizing transaminase